MRISGGIRELDTGIVELIVIPIAENFMRPERGVHWIVIHIAGSAITPCFKMDNRNFIEERLHWIHWIWSKVLFEEGRIVFLSQMPFWAIW